ncbi:zinc-binding metallopeptidase family protein [Ramlibacter rhizophilus]|uniref:Zinc-ribbon domain-containing protein n=1 Tax=Ramlibacter rhizophilus TaxID=1781167 RepID=A0A4Z0BU02_9BURK|nr:putative zinc-binding metallopeptidase [Ramlibacter rhizophilus]TFZ01485.1 hypothetical protein EZ242_08930 [Ramlibacter rhizophilus]
MRIFRCDHCGNALFFENVRCLRCSSELAFLPDRMALCAIEPAEVAGTWRRKGGADPGRWRPCEHTRTRACNFGVAADDPNPLCVSCRQTRRLPDLSIPDNRRRWFRIEVAKRRLFFTLARLGLVDTRPAGGESTGPRFHFLANLPHEPVLTGHSDGVITLNVAEADDDERVRRRLALHEPYRTLLGHLRHESGHFYWEQLIDQAGRHEDFRRAFGDERADYAAALDRHYTHGPPAGWQERHVSAYATSHPWEDWAETWAHYLHLVDLMETASSFQTQLALPGFETEQVPDPFAGAPLDFDSLLRHWLPLTVLVNSLTRSLGQEDAYPFAPSPAALDKLHFVHDLIHAQAAPR